LIKVKRNGDEKRNSDDDDHDEDNAESKRRKQKPKEVNDDQIDSMRKPDEEDADSRPAADGGPKIGDHRLRRLNKDGDTKPKGEEDDEEDGKSERSKRKPEDIDSDALTKREVEKEEPDDTKSRIGEQRLRGDEKGAIDGEIELKSSAKRKAEDHDDGDNDSTKVTGARPKRGIEGDDDSPRKAPDEQGLPRNAVSNLDDEKAKKREDFGDDIPNVARKKQKRGHDAAAVTAGVAVVVGLSVGLISTGSVFWIRRRTIAKNADIAEADMPLLGTAEFCDSA
jgi:hypothetical protein